MKKEISIEKGSMMKVAVILCGSGYKDGSEIRESVLTLLALDQEQIQYQCFSPINNQTDVVNCLTGQVMHEESRQMIVEAARIARGNVLPLSDLKEKNYDALVIPGGFGVAKNLCNFAFTGSASIVHSEVEAVLKSFHQAQKFIGAICIAPVLLALTFKTIKIKITLGASSGAVSEIEKLGHLHEECRASDIVVDEVNKFVTTPAYMYDDASLSDIFRGISLLVKKLSDSHNT